MSHINGWQVNFSCVHPPVGLGVQLIRSFCVSSITAIVPNPFSLWPFLITTSLRWESNELILAMKYAWRATILGPGLIFYSLACDTSLWFGQYILISHNIRVVLVKSDSCCNVTVLQEPILQRMMFYYIGHYSNKVEYY